jgi:hypothetical protein
MSHAAHFLRRLERISTPQVDFALALYRDPHLIAYLLTRVSLPSGAERVALALEHEPEGPHIIISRDGRFITCLGEGMSVGDLPVVARSQLDLASEEFGKLREAIEHVKERGEQDQLVDRMIRAGRYLSREDFVVLSFLYPLMLPSLWRLTADIADNLVRFRETYQPRQYRRLAPDTRKRLHAYWQQTWAMGHLLTLHGEHADAFLDFMEPAIRAEQLNTFLVLPWPGMRTGSMAVVLRAIWAVARAGRRVLPAGKQLYEEAPTYMQMFTAALGLCGLGMRHRRLRAEVRKLLSRRNSPIFDPGRAPPAQSYRANLLVDYCETLLDHEEPLQATHRTLGANLVVSGTELLPEDHPGRSIRAEDVPEELAGWLALNMDTSVLGSQTEIVFMGMVLPGLAHSSAEELYLPERVIREYEERWQPDDTLEQLEAYRRFNRLPRTVAYRDAKIGRNAPCPCGSGKKHKHCCMDAG